MYSNFMNNYNRNEINLGLLFIGTKYLSTYLLIHYNQGTQEKANIIYIIRFNYFLNRLLI